MFAQHPAGSQAWLQGEFARLAQERDEQLDVINEFRCRQLAEIHEAWQDDKDVVWQDYEARCSRLKRVAA